MWMISSKIYLGKKLILIRKNIADFNIMDCSEIIIGGLGVCYADG